jgi:hypothetical protein
MEWNSVVELPFFPEIGSRNSDIAQPSPFFMFSGCTSSTCTRGYLRDIPNLKPVHVTQINAD